MGVSEQQRRVLERSGGNRLENRPSVAAETGGTTGGLGRR